MTVYLQYICSLPQKGSDSTGVSNAFVEVFQIYISQGMNKIIIDRVITVHL